jgi:NAD(P)-dependent dehydrogenase (short-subunit alcohol dehydrogenase family)
MGQACATQVCTLVDRIVLVDRDEALLARAVEDLAGTGGAAGVEAFSLDITDGVGVARLVSRVAELGTLRAVAHAAGVSPTMADWRRVLAIDLVGTAMLTEAFFPLATEGTALVCFASMAPLLAPGVVDPVRDAILDGPLDARFLDRLHEVVGAEIEDPGMAYMWAKRGVHRLVRREAVRFGQVGARICSVSPGIIDTPMGRQEAEARPTNDMLVQRTPLGREGRAGEVAAAAAFLLSDDASFVNGIDLLVDGGVVAALSST